MKLGIPGSDTTSSGDFLSRVQYDARVGLWQIVKRVQGADGKWISDFGEQFKNPTMLYDFGSLEVGYLKFAAPPGFVLVPYGQTVPPRPEETQANDQGQQRRAFQPGFRIRVASSKTFGDADAYHWSHNAKTVLEAMDELHKAFLAAPEATDGKVPLVAVTGTRIIELAKQRYHAPIFQIAGWFERIPAFGERTVPAPRTPLAATPISQMQPAQVADMAKASVPTPGTKLTADEMPF